uniref:hypothetical protein n=1 Tax=Microbispora cellulosiformans TaxID=2614688 RepID=UPI001786CF22|nr:hypothetical protein [Microbispora cellulosiformans]
MNATVAARAAIVVAVLLAVVAAVFMLYEAVQVLVGFVVAAVVLAWLPWFTSFC